MKISKERLKQIVQEELAVGVVPAQEMRSGGRTRDPDGYEGRMAKQNLWKLANYAQELHDLISDDENLEPWVEEKIAVASFMIDSVAHYVEYEKHRAHEDMEGECGHADFPAEMEAETGMPVGIEVTGTGMPAGEEGEEEYEFEPDEEGEEMEMEEPEEYEDDEEGEYEEEGEEEEYEDEEGER